MTTAASDNSTKLSTTKVASSGWGRAWETSWLSSAGVFLLLTTTPFMVIWFYVACYGYHGSLVAAIKDLATPHFLAHLPTFSWHAVGIIALWLAAQIIFATWTPDILHKILPSYVGGRRKGSVTPAGNQLTYSINGLQAWVLSHLFFFLGAAYFFTPTVIFDHWGALLIGANVLGYIVALFAYAKAHLFPSHADDRKFSGNKFYDFFMGVEHNPRIGNFDFKLFFNGRPGIVAWTLINVSFAYQQYHLYGYVTNSMIAVNVLQALYVLYFFWNEAWYLNTIDINHDHFGWMLAWGDCVWLPWMYTLQGLYLVFNPIEMSLPLAIAVWGLGIAGFYIFLSANNQKERFRRTDGKTKIWGKTPKAIHCSYKSADGQERKSKLLTSGWWGMSRHMNYTGDLMGCAAYSLACGFEHMLPYFYLIYMTILLVHRCYRDEHRLQRKYGEAWEKYTSAVPYRLIPGIY